MRRWKQGTRINLERSLKIGDELGGHLVSGHVDGIAELIERKDMTDQVRFRLRAVPELSRFIAKKGSVALDGVSLTVNEVEGNEFLGAGDPAYPAGDHVLAASGGQGQWRTACIWRWIQMATLCGQADGDAKLARLRPRARLW